MPQVQLQSLGSDDAFASGGRFQTCFLLHRTVGHLLNDCGASSRIAMKRAREFPQTSAGSSRAISRWTTAVEYHSDSDGQFSRSARLLVVSGPPGLKARMDATMEVCF